MSAYFQEALREWWHVAWSELLAYQKRFVENGYHEDGTWAYQIATALLQNYEWRMVRANAAEDTHLNARLNSTVRTALGGTGTHSLEQIAHAFFQESWNRISIGRLLVGDPDIVFAEVFARIEPFLWSNTIPYEGLTQLHNVRVAAPIVLDGRTVLRQLTADERQHVRFNSAAWDDPWETCAALERRYDLPILSGEAAGDAAPIYAEQQAAAHDALLAIAVAVRQRGTIGMTSVGPGAWTPSPAYTSMGSDYPHGNGRSRLTAEQAVIVQNTWAALLAGNRTIRLSAERIADARRLSDPSDAIIDTLTALEAVIGLEAERQLSRRLSLYAARVCSAAIGVSQRELYDALLEWFARRQAALRGKDRTETSVEHARIGELIETTVRTLIQMRLRGDPALKADNMQNILLSSPPEVVST